MSEEFQDALAEGRLVDEAYLARLDGISGDDENSADKLNAAERELKDRIRGQLPSSGPPAAPYPTFLRRS